MGLILPLLPDHCLILPHPCPQLQTFQQSCFPVFYEEGSYVQQILEKLEVCEENNISVSFLLSPHYFHESIIDEYGIRREGYGFHKYDVNSPGARKIMDEHFKNVLSLVKDYDCIANITVSNEPYFRVEECGGLMTMNGTSSCGRPMVL